MKHDFDARHLNLAAFAQANELLKGEKRLSSFERLLGETQASPAGVAVAFSAQGEMRQDGAGKEQVWVRLAAKAVLSLICQRCLESADTIVAFERDFRFVVGEDQAATEDETSEEDVLALSRAFNLLDLIEDELLMALPITPMHDVCPTPVKLQVVDPDFDDSALEKPNPFAVLQQLKKN